MDVSRSRPLGPVSLENLTPSVAEAFQLLGISPDSSDAEIRSVYLKSALKLHPDRNPNQDTTDAMQELQVAYQIIRERNNEGLDFSNDPVGRIWHDLVASEKRIVFKGCRSMALYILSYEDQFREWKEEMTTTGEDRTTEIKFGQEWLERKLLETRESVHEDIRRGRALAQSQTDDAITMMRLSNILDDWSKAGYFMYAGCGFSASIAISIWMWGFGKVLKSFAISAVVGILVVNGGLIFVHKYIRAPELEVLYQEQLPNHDKTKPDENKAE
ncbi:hypothetical protein BGAL_0567g00020 [Botrytis galanthina]|uniref:J domain-containing protein n=1 Tax=Botrytis galanthina TaxID=278940 RepID=A0A4S8QJ72_9HELO|nr:hypothetical protein BGAL_0567g00020 [Botrytis galanthina]